MTRSEIGLIKNQYIGEYHIAIVMGIGIWGKKNIQRNVIPLGFICHKSIFNGCSWKLLEVKSINICAILEIMNIILIVDAIYIYGVIVWCTHVQNPLSLVSVFPSNGRSTGKIRLIIYSLHLYNQLVVSTPLKNINQLGLFFPIYGKNVPNHQPGRVYVHPINTFDISNIDYDIHLQLSNVQIPNVSFDDGCLRTRFLAHRF